MVWWKMKICWTLAASLKTSGTRQERMERLGRAIDCMWNGSLQKSNVTLIFFYCYYFCCYLYRHYCLSYFYDRHQEYKCSFLDYVSNISSLPLFVVHLMSTFYISCYFQAKFQENERTIFSFFPLNIQITCEWSKEGQQEEK